MKATASQSLVFGLCLAIIGVKANPVAIDISGNTSPNPLIRRTLQDLYLRCRGPIPGRYDGWPQGYYPRQYRNILDLCSSLQGRKSTIGESRNVGCSCPYPASDVTCLESAADANLWAATLDYQTTHFHTFQQMCDNQCRCITQDQYDEHVTWVKQQAAEASAANGNGTDAADAASQVGSDNDWTDNGDPFFAGGGGFELDDGGQENTAINSPGTNPTNADTVEEACNQTCFSLDDCSTKPSDCYCGLVGEQVIPGPIIKSIYGCRFSSGLGKRSEQDVCPCNSTYVSRGCCDAEPHGIIWEDPSLKLGDIDTWIQGLDL